MRWTGSRDDRRAENNRGVEQDSTGAYRTNHDIQTRFRDRVAEDPNLRRGVTIKSSRGYRWDLSDEGGVP